MYAADTHSDGLSTSACEAARTDEPVRSGVPYGVTSARLSQSRCWYIWTRTPTATTDELHLTVVTSPETYCDIPRPQSTRLPLSVRSHTLYELNRYQQQSTRFVVWGAWRRHAYAQLGTGELGAV